MSKLIKLPNIGKVAESLLIKAGVDTPEKLMAIGSKQAFLKIRNIEPTACLHMLYGIEGAVAGISDTKLSPEKKLELKEFFYSL